MSVQRIIRSPLIYLQAFYPLDVRCIRSFMDDIEEDPLNVPSIRLLTSIRLLIFDDVQRANVSSTAGRRQIFHDKATNSHQLHMKGQR
jgi:hypothetical protein